MIANTLGTPLYQHNEEHDKKSNRDIALLALLLFAILRPICSIDFPTVTNISFLRLNEYFNLVFSYLALIVVLLRIRLIKWNIVDLFFLLIISYSIISLTWGSNIREMSKVIFPMFIYFLARSSRISIVDTYKVLFVLVVVFSFPMIFNALLIVGNYGSRGIGYWTGIERFQGIYGGPHTLAHESLIYIFLVVFMMYLMQLAKVKFDKKWIYFFLVVIVLALFNVYKSYTRTVYFGLTLFAIIFLIGNKKYLFVTIISLIAFIFIAQSEAFRTLFFDVIQPLEGTQEIEEMGSGRIGIWKNNFNIFFDKPDRWLIGLGIGMEVLGNRNYFGASHNDILSILISLGLVGLLLYLLVKFTFFLIVMTSPVDKKLKIFICSFILSVFLMNLLSNSYLNRFPLAQYNYLIMGLMLNILDSLQNHNTQKLENS